MEDKIVCRVMVFSYKELVKRCDVIDKAIYIKAIHSAFKNTMEAYKEIEKLTQEKIAYINTKVVIDQALATMGGRTYELEQYHIKGASIVDIATTLGADEHIVKRRIECQRARLYNKMLKLHSGEELLEIMYRSGWLMCRYRELIKSKPKTKPKTDGKIKG